LFNRVRGPTIQHIYNTPPASWTGTPNDLEKKAFMHKRIHSASGYLTPVEFEAQFYVQTPDDGEQVH